MAVSFTYDYATVRDMTASQISVDERGKKTVDEMTINGEPLTPSSRFWVSLMATYGFNSAFFKYFDHAEVFERISEVESSRDRVRFCVERGEDATGQPYNRLLGVSKPTKPVITFDELQEKLETHGTHGTQYADGIVESFHTPRVGAMEFDVAGDLFNNRFVVATPIDGYGLPNVYLSLLRQVCSNGAIAYAKSFRSSIKLGKGDEDTSFSFVRVLDQFSNDEGYAAMRQRFESAAKSWASVYECQGLYKVLVAALNRTDALEQSPRELATTPFIKDALEKHYKRSSNADETLGTAVLNAFHATTGDITELYGLSNLDAMSLKRQKTMPTKATVYDLLNFATEIATHHSDVATGRQLQGWAGTMISGEYDMEGTQEKYREFADFHLSAKIGITEKQDHKNN